MNYSTDTNKQLQELSKELDIFFSEDGFSISEKEIIKNVPTTENKYGFMLKKLAIDPYYLDCLAYFIYFKSPFSFKSPNAQYDLPRIIIPENPQLKFIFDKFCHKESNQIIDEIFLKNPIDKKIINNITYPDENSIDKAISKGYVYIIQGEQTPLLKITIFPLNDYTNNGFLKITLETQKQQTVRYYSQLDVLHNEQLKQNLDKLNINYNMRQLLNDEDTNQEFLEDLPKYLENLKSVKSQIISLESSFAKYELSHRLKNNLKEKQAQSFNKI